MSEKNENDLKKHILFKTPFFLMETSIKSERLENNTNELVFPSILPRPAVLGRVRTSIAAGGQFLRPKHFESLKGYAHPESLKRVRFAAGFCFLFLFVLLFFALLLFLTFLFILLLTSSLPFFPHSLFFLGSLCCGSVLRHLYSSWGASAHSPNTTRSPHQAHAPHVGFQDR